MKTLPTLLFVLTLTQAALLCIKDVQRVNPAFDAGVDADGQITWFANRQTLGLFQQCMRDHGHNVDGATLSFESPS